MLLLVTVCLLAACGGGGGGGAGGTAAPPASDVTVTGGVSANIIYPGTVRIFGVNADGTLKSPALAVGATDANGQYSVPIGNYQGALVGLAFGRYIDEATKTPIDVPEGKGLHGALSASDTAGRTAIVLNITPLSDLAYRKARSSADFNGNISSANQAIGQLLGVDIINTTPVPFDAATLSNSATTGAQTKLAATLATVSQFVAVYSANPAAPTASDLQNALTALADGATISNGTVQFSPIISYLVQQASGAVTTNPNTQPIIAAGGTAAQSPLATLAAIGSSAGKKIVKIRVRTMSSSFTGKIGGVTLAMGIPAGVSLSTDLTGQTAAGVVAASGMAAVDSRVDGRLAGSTLTITVINAFGFSVGEFVTVYGEIPAAASPPAAADFAPLVLDKVVDLDSGAVIPGVAIEVF
jgi:hypothetical protein